MTRSDSVEPSRAAIDLATKTFFYEPKVISDCIAFRSEKAGEGITQMLFAADNCFGVTFGKYTAVVLKFKDSRIPMNCFAPSVVRSDNVQPFCEMPIGVLSQFAGPYLPQPAEPRIPNPFSPHRAGAQFLIPCTIAIDGDGLVRKMITDAHR